MLILGRFFYIRYPFFLYICNIRQAKMSVSTSYKKGFNLTCGSRIRNVKARKKQ